MLRLRTRKYDLTTPAPHSAIAAWPVRLAAWPGDYPRAWEFAPPIFALPTDSESPPEADMRCDEVMTRHFLICHPTSHLCDLKARWESLHEIAIVIADGSPKGVLPATVITNVRPSDRDDPTCTAQGALLPISRCSQSDSLGYIGAKILRENTYAAIVHEDEMVVGVAVLLDILQALLWGSSKRAPLPEELQYRPFL
jgi:hypothetical protein